MSSPSLILFTTSQTPLPTRYPHPHKPNLILPPLLHRSLHSSLDDTPPSTSTLNNTLYIPNPESLIKHDQPLSPTPPPSSTTPSDPNVDGQPPLATSSSPSEEITAKIHLVSPGSTSSYLTSIPAALSILSKYKGLSRIDNLLLGFGGIDYRGKKTAAAEMFGCGSEGMEGDTGSEVVSPEREKEVVDLWKGLSGVERKGEGMEEVKVERYGTLYLPLGMLKTLSDLSAGEGQGEGQGKGEVKRVGINALDTPDCHHLPKEYTEFAKERGIELWAGGGGEGSDPLPAVELHNLLQEFHTTIQTSLEGKDTSKLAQLIPLREDRLKYEVEATKVGVSVRWVLGYSLVSKTRNVVQDKGYIIAADLV